MPPFLHVVSSRPRPATDVLRATTLLIVGFLASGNAAHSQQITGNPIVAGVPAQFAPLPNKPSATSVLDQVRKTPSVSVKALREQISVLKAVIQVSKPRTATEVAALQIEQQNLNKLEALLSELSIRAYPYDVVDGFAIQQALAHRDVMPAATMGFPKASASAVKNSTASVRALVAQPYVPISPGVVKIPSLNPNWQYVGPRNNPASDLNDANSFGSGRVNPAATGRVSAVAFDVVHAGTVYLVAPTGGVWKSVDSGYNWASLSDGASFPTLSASSVAVHPTTGNVVLVGTGDYDGGEALGHGVGIMRSADAGQTWANVGNALMSGLAVSGVAIDPDNPLVAIAVSGRGVAGTQGSIYRSADGGVTWLKVTNVPAGDYSSLSVGIKDATTGRRAYYASLEGQGIYKSSDQGQTWVKIPAPINFSNQGGGAVGLRIAASKLDANTVYMIDGNSTLSDGRIYRSKDGGTTWTDVTGTYPNGVGFNGAGQLSALPGYNWLFSDYSLFLAPSVVTYNGKLQESLFAGGVTLGFALNGGTNFTDIGLTYAANPDVSKTHAFEHNVAIDTANTNRALVENDGGVYEMRFNPATGVWAFQSTPSLNSTLGVTQLYKGAWHPTNPDIMLGASNNTATPTSNGNLQNWINPGIDITTSVAVNPLAGATQYSSSYDYSYFFRTDDNWATKQRLAPPFVPGEATPFFTTLAITPSGAFNRYMMFGTQYLWVYDHNLNGYYPHIGSKQLTTGNNFITAIAIPPGPGTQTIVYVGTADGKLWVTSDWTGAPTGPATAVWFQIDHTGGGQGIANRAITAIDVRPNNPYDIIVTVSGTGTGHVFRCTDTYSGINGGPINFTDQSGLAGQTALPNIPVNDITRDPNDPDNTYYVGTDIGVFMTSNNGASWSNATTPLGLPNVQVNQIRAIPGTGYLNVATYGRGFWRIPLSNSQVVANPGPANLSYRTSITRNGANLIVTVAVTNAINAGPANVAQISSAALSVGGKSVTPTSPLPVALGTIAPGQTVTATMTFSGALGKPGTLATFTATGSYAGGSFVVPSSTFRLP